MFRWQLKTPVAFFVFNRPDTTERAFDAIRNAAPSRLLLVADGPRADHEGEAEKCAAVRDIICRIDWPCQVSTNFSDTNMGCKIRISSGLDWVFQTVEEAIILEDDCLPDQSFFRFCEDLLTRYRDDCRIAMISGNNFERGAGCREDSYYFSRYPHIWGWASWRRTWEHYDVDIKAWPELDGQGWLEKIFSCRKLAGFWREAFDSVHCRAFDTWDHQFFFSCLVHGGLCIMPSVNLVSNIGFGADATHTKVKGGLANLPTRAISFPLRHPHVIERDVKADRATESEQHLPPGFLQKLRMLLKQMSGRVMKGAQ